MTCSRIQKAIMRAASEMRTASTPEQAESNMNTHDINPRTTRSQPPFVLVAPAAALRSAIHKSPDCGADQASPRRR
jgi:hypothetical protein